MAANIEDAYRMLSWLLLRGPRDPRRQESSVYRLASSILQNFGYSPSASPVTAIGMGMADRDRGAVLVFLREEKARGIGIEGARQLGLGESETFLVTEQVSGPIYLSGRPSQGGDSLGEGRPRGKSGTFGCLVKNAAGDPFLLSCAHVVVGPALLAASQRSKDPVWQPSYEDGGGSSDTIGVLEDYSSISFGGFIPNSIDAALVRPNDPNHVIAGLRSCGAINGTAAGLQYRNLVKKIGWKTALRDGNFLYRTSHIQDFNGQDALFEDQIGIVWQTPSQPFSDFGDSGSLVINGQNEAVGLLFATAPYIRMSFANPIRRVFAHFGVIPV